MSEKRPIRKTEARIAERQRVQAAEQHKGTMRKFVPLGIVFLVAVLIVFVGLTTLQQASNQNLQGATGPRLQVDRDKIDLGKRIFDKSVRAAFTVKNVGDSPLKLEASRVATLIEGC